MKKILSLILCGMLVLTLTACGNKETTNENNDNKEEKVENKILKCTSGDSDSDYEREYTYVFTFDESGNKLETIYFKDSISYIGTKLSDYNINENKKWCSQANGYGGLECLYEISSDKKISTIEYTFEVNKLDDDAKDILESEMQSGLEKYNYDSLKTMLAGNGLTCK